VIPTNILFEKVVSGRTNQDPNGEVIGFVSFDYGDVIRIHRIPVIRTHAPDNLLAFSMPAADSTGGVDLPLLEFLNRDGRAEFLHALERHIESDIYVPISVGGVFRVFLKGTA
jgi:hypothetical protein